MKNFKTMKNMKYLLSADKSAFVATAFLLFSTTNLFAQEDTSLRKSLEVYGFAMVDMGYNFKQINPKWSDAMRINRLPKYKDEFAPDGTFFFGVRQTRLA